MTTHSSTTLSYFNNPIFENENLRDAIYGKDLKRCKKIIIEEDKNPNCFVYFNGKCETPLSLAIKLARYDCNVSNEIVDFFLSESDVNYCNGIALFRAINKQDKKLVERMIKLGANIFIRSDKGIPLYYAIKLSSIDIIRMLLEYGANANEWSIKSCPILYASALNRANVVELLLNYGANPNIIKGKRETPLYWATRHRNLTMLKLLYQKDTVSNKKFIFKQLRKSIINKQTTNEERVNTTTLITNLGLIV